MAVPEVADERVPGYLGRVLDGDGVVGTCFQVAPGVLVVKLPLASTPSLFPNEVPEGVRPM